MALPTDSTDTFLREVDENLRRDQLRDAAQRYGKWVGAAVLLFLLAIGGWLFWQERQRQQSAAAGEELAAIYKDIGEGKLNTVPQRLASLEGRGGDVVRASALFTSAAVALERNNRPQAIAKLREVQNDGGLPQPYRDLALIRLTALEFDTLKPDEIIARMQPLAVKGGPWFGSAAELSAMALIKQGKRAEAGRTFAAIAADEQAPATIRSRAVQIAGTLGVDASAALPSIEQQIGAR